jgi:hypothetical protein
MSKELKKAHAAFDEYASSLRRVGALPPDALTLEERLTLWAQLETLSLKLTDLVRTGLPYLHYVKQQPGL